ncbi:MAG: hypothetical protein FWF73_04690 [Spirochaetes bacterium]|nr:hypothetical protein [Spirochaetota bacterium]
MNTGRDVKAMSRFQIFYNEVILNDPIIPPVNKVRSLFADITIEEFILFVDKVFTLEDNELMQHFIYYFILFSDMDHIQKYINSDKFTIDRLEQLILFTVGYCTMHDIPIDRTIDKILFFLDKDKLMELALNSTVINNDKFMLFMILTKFDTDMLNRFFLKIKDVSGFINFFIRLPDDVLRSIISRNYHLFQYIMLMMSEVEALGTLSAEFIKKYSLDLQQFGKLNDILKKYRDNTNIEIDKNLPLQKRDMQRLAFLVNMVRELNDPVQAVEYYSGENVFIDELEKNFVLAVVTDPMLKHIFAKYEIIGKLKKK